LIVNLILSKFLTAFSFLTLLGIRKGIRRLKTKCCYAGDYLTGTERNLVCWRKFWFHQQPRSKISTFCQSNMAAGRHIENRFGVYLNDLLSD